MKKKYKKTPFHSFSNLHLNVKTILCKNFFQLRNLWFALFLCSAYYSDTSYARAGGATNYSPIINICNKSHQIAQAILKQLKRTDTCLKNAFQINVHTNDLKMITSLDLSNQSISSLKKEDFEHLSELTKINLSHNQIQELTKDVFEKTPKLKTLILKNNQIQSIDKDTFQSLKQLENLTLESNQLSSLHSSTFNTLAHLKNLSLNHNQLNTIPQDLFKNNRSLEFAFINHNPLKSIPGICSLNENQSIQVYIDNLDGIDIPEECRQNFTATVHQNQIAEAGSAECTGDCDGNSESQSITKLQTQVQELTQTIQQFQTRFNQQETKKATKDKSKTAKKPIDDEKDKTVSDQEIAQDLSDCLKADGNWKKLNSTNQKICSLLKALHDQKNANAQLMQFQQHVQSQLWNTVQNGQLTQPFSQYPSIHALSQNKMLPSAASMQNLKFMNYINSIQQRVSSLYQGVQKKSINSQLTGLINRVDQALQESPQTPMNPHAYDSLSSDLQNFQSYLSTVSSGS